MREAGFLTDSADYAVYETIRIGTGRRIAGHVKKAGK